MEGKLLARGEREEPGSCLRKGNINWRGILFGRNCYRLSKEGILSLEDRADQKEKEKYRGNILEEGDTCITSASCGFLCVHGILLCFLPIMRFYPDI